MKLEQKEERATEKCIYFYNNLRLLHYLPSCSSVASPSLQIRSVPAEWDVAGSVASLFHQGFMKFSPGTRVDGCPAVLAVVLQAGDVGAEERCKLAATASSLALIAQLVIQHIWLHFHLKVEDKSSHF